MAQFFNDTFTTGATTGQTNLSSHTSDSGHGWVDGNADTADRIENSGNYAVGQSQANARLFPYSLVTPPSADYSVAMDVTVLDTVNFTISGPAARLQGATKKSAYAFCVDPNEQTVALYRYDEGTEVLIGTPFAVDLSVTPVTLNLKVEPNGSTITGYLNGVQRDQVTNETTYSAAGSVGYIRRIATDFQNFQFDNISADTLGAPSPSVTAPASVSPGETIAFTAANFTPNAATVSDGTSTLTLTNIVNTSGDNYTAVVPSLPASGESLQYTTFGAVTLEVTDGTDTASDTTSLAAATGQTVTTLAATFDASELSYLFNFSGTPATGDQFIEGEADLALDANGGYVADTDGTYVITGIDATDGIAQSYELIVGPGETPSVVGKITRRNLTRRAMTRRSLTSR